MSPKPWSSGKCPGRWYAFARTGGVLPWAHSTPSAGGGVNASAASRADAVREGRPVSAR